MILHAGWATFTLEILHVEALKLKSRYRRVVCNGGQPIKEEGRDTPKNIF